MRPSRLPSWKLLFLVPALLIYAVLAKETYSAFIRSWEGIIGSFFMMGAMFMIADLLYQRIHQQLQPKWYWALFCIGGAVALTFLHTRIITDLGPKYLLYPLPFFLGAFSMKLLIWYWIQRSPAL